MNTLPELKKPSACIHVDHNLSGPAMRLYNCLLAYCQEEIPEVAEVPYLTIPREVVREYMNTRKDDFIKGWLKELSDASVEFNNLGKGGLPSWGYYHFIQEPEYRGAYIRFGMAQTLRGLIADSTMFAKINLLTERRFKKTKHALPLYELGLDYRGNKDRETGKGTTPWMEVEQFRKYMGINPGEYQTGFGQFNRAVIQPALAEIRAESDILMTMEKETEKREVKRIRFLIEDNTANMSAVERLRRVQATLPGLDGQAGIEASRYAEFLTQAFDVHPPRAKKIARLYVGHQAEFERVCQKVEADKLAGKVKGLGAYAARVFTAENPVASIAR